MTHEDAKQPFSADELAHMATTAVLFKEDSRRLYAMANGVPMTVGETDRRNHLRHAALFAETIAYDITRMHRILSLLSEDT